MKSSLSGRKEKQGRFFVFRIFGCRFFVLIQHHVDYSMNYFEIALIISQILPQIYCYAFLRSGLSSSFVIS